LWEEDFLLENQLEESKVSPTSIPEGNPPYKPFPSGSISLVSLGTPQNLKSTIMVGVNQPRRPWLNTGVVAVFGDSHDLPKNPEKFLPKFDPDNREVHVDHISRFMLAVNLKGVQYEYVVCILFLYTFEGRVRQKYFVLWRNIYVTMNSSLSYT
jgi:hypothetical protein